MLLGRQGAGKGTQADRLSRHYVVPHISTGDMLRAAVREGTEFGRKAKEYMDAGDLLPDDIMVGIVDERLERDDTRTRGFILDGFPRTVPQAEALIEVAAPSGIDVAVNLDVAREIVLARLSGRRACPNCGTNYSEAAPPKVNWTCDICGSHVVQRDDDTDAAIQHRLDLFELETSPLIAWFEARHLLVTVDGVGDTDAVTDRLVRGVDGHRDATRA